VRSRCSGWAIRCAISTQRRSSSAFELGQVAALQPWRKHLFAHTWPGKQQT
jgi:hypothetical protein